MTRLLTVVATFLALLLLPVPLANAEPAQVTEFPFTEAVYNTCNDDLLVVNGTLVDSVRIIPRPNGGMTYKHVVRWKDVEVTSQLGIAYEVKKGSVDYFSTRIRNGAEVQRSLQASWLRLRPVDRESGDLRVIAVYAYTTDAQGVTRTLDRYFSACS